jgi:DNA damage-binding protein 1
VIKGIGGLVHSEWRQFANDRAVHDSKCFIDGDLIESFLDMPAAKQAEVVALINEESAMKMTDEEPITVEAVLKCVEELNRLH